MESDIGLVGLEKAIVKNNPEKIITFDRAFGKNDQHPSSSGKCWSEGV